MAHPSWFAHLSGYDQIESGIIQPMIEWLCNGQSLTVLDAGCGRGQQALWFANEGCHVTGVDMNPQSLKSAIDLSQKTPLVDTIQFHHSDIRALPFADETFDLVWTSYVLHHISDLHRTVNELKRVLKSGGRLAIREGGLPLQMLPHDIGMGEPGLQDRLRVAQNRWFDTMTKATLSQSDQFHYPYGWSQLLHDAHFADIHAKTFVTEFLSPFDAIQSEFVMWHLNRFLERDHGEYGPILEPDDRKTVERLVDHTDDFYILNRNDIHVRYGLSVYVGTKE